MAFAISMFGHGLSCPLNQNFEKISRFSKSVNLTSLIGIEI